MSDNPSDIPYPSGKEPEIEEKEAGLLEIVGASFVVGLFVAGIIALLVGWFAWGNPLQEKGAQYDDLAAAALQVDEQNEKMRAAIGPLMDTAFYSGVQFGCEFDKVGGEMFKVTGEDVGCVALSRSALNARLDLAAKSRGEPQP